MKRAFTLLTLAMLCGTALPADMFVKQKDGTVARFEVERVEEVYFSEPNPEDLTFRVTSDSTDSRTAAD